ncbi:TPA: glycosyltransferase [Candidatus Gracilibacteria bacterium]|nr:glycosyltransferase [Candidatus Peregrinibacteria bacterium]HIQ57049.1 glycosyltransferase [Candidatus Gracilibacteria bacterium]HIQ57218.1 glycosyltransferase [Candidatus Gracilibacteria bacterium]
MNTINICWIDNGDFLGGAELFSVDMIQTLIIYKNTLPDTILNIDIYSNSINNNNAFAQQVTTIQELSKDNPNITINHKSLFLPSLKPISYQNIKNFIKSVFKIKNIVQENKYNTVYANTVRSGIITGISQFFFPKDTKTIFMSHDYTMPKILAKFLIPQFSQILACSYSVKKYLLESGIKPWKIEVIKNGVNIEQLSSLPEITAPLFSASIIGRIAPWKGQMIVLESALWLKENAKEFPFQFTIYGAASNKMEDLTYEKNLHKFVKDNNLEKNIRFAGFTPLQTALKESKIVIHASTEKEPFGRTPIEAGASKRIACISNIGTPAKIFTDKENAFFFEAGNSESLAHTLIIIAHNKDKALQIAENSQKFVQDKFNLENISKLFWSYFQ